MFELPQLPYSYDALEPHVDAKTMEIHHSKHHAGYTNKLNKALEGVDTDNKSIEEILKTLDMNNTAVRNNGGGYYNHKIFWEVMTPGGSELSGLLLEKINDSFGSFDDFKDKFSKAAASRFGSGWAWLCKKDDGSLEVVSTANQDNPLMPGVEGGIPILGIDVWEHAYYLNYQNRRPDYIEAFFNVIDWNKVTELYER